MVDIGLAQSKSAARRLVGQGAVRVNDTRIETIDYSLTGNDFAEAAATLRAGKKKIHRLVLDA